MTLPIVQYRNPGAEDDPLEKAFAVRGGPGYWLRSYFLMTHSFSRRIFNDSLLFVILIR